MTIPVYNDLDVRRRLITHCQLKGGVTAFAREHGLERHYVADAMRGQAALSKKLLRVLGYEPVTRYVEIAEVPFQ